MPPPPSLVYIPPLPPRPPHSRIHRAIPPPKPLQPRHLPPLGQDRPQMGPTERRPPLPTSTVKIPQRIPAPPQPREVVVTKQTLPPERRVQRSPQTERRRRLPVTRAVAEAAAPRADDGRVPHLPQVLLHAVDFQGPPATLERGWLAFVELGGEHVAGAWWRRAAAAQDCEAVGVGCGEGEAVEEGEAEEELGDVSRGGREEVMGSRRLGSRDLRIPVCGGCDGRRLSS